VSSHLTLFAYLLTLASFDFYLQSHKGIKGTAKPSHYFVLQDDLGFSAEQLQNFVHSLCHTYGRSTTSVSYATPTYYADRLCARVRCYFADWLNGTRTQNPPQAGETQAQRNWIDFRDDWISHVLTTQNLARNPWHPNLNDSTFWM
jgi:eukaryotic translation initiation factor 2C